MIVFALDYDGTYTKDPELWKAFVVLALARGHQVVCVTMRHEHELGDFCPWLKSKVEVICTGRKAKAAFLSSGTLRPDIWIDDNPLWIFQDA